VTAAAAERQAAREAEWDSVYKLHCSVIDAIDAPACHHSHREVAKAARLTLGGLHNALAGAGGRPTKGDDGRVQRRRREEERRKGDRRDSDGDPADF
jgi:hypothetical protein